MNTNFLKILKKSSTLLAGLMLTLQLTIPASVFAQTIDITEERVVIEEQSLDEEDPINTTLPCIELNEVGQDYLFIEDVILGRDEVTKECEVPEQSDEVIPLEDLDEVRNDDIVETDRTIDEATEDAVLVDEVVETQELPQILVSNHYEYEQDYCDELSEFSLLSERDYTCKEPSGTISGFKYNDKNGSGSESPDDGEENLEGWTISYCQISSDPNDDLEVFNLNDCSGYILNTQTDENGEYMFPDVGIGAYLVCETAQKGWTRTYPATNDCQIVRVERNDQICIAIFGNKQNPVLPLNVPEVLGTITAPKVKVLADTGTSLTQSIVVGATLLTTVLCVTTLNRRTQYISK